MSQRSPQIAFFNSESGVSAGEEEEEEDVHWDPEGE